MYLSSNEKVARFKKGTSGVHTIKTTQGKYSITFRPFLSRKLLNNKRKNSKNKACNIFNFYILAFIICWYAEPTMPEQAATVTEKLGDYLIQVGY